ncbi:restriction endonuclease subunit S [Azospirillum sp. 11R-A]|uniref:restriction endonuclease subunit S n=1 Tax=Azospirillum sp. 11R-A TaxID=3111634 RepID=UPI003C28CF18
MQEVHLADLLSFTRDGEWGNGEASEGYSPALVIRGTDFERVRAGDLNTLPLRYIRSDILTRKTVTAGDTLIETAGGTKDQPTGRTVFIPSSVIAATNLPLICASFARFLRPDSNLVDPQFLFWKLQDEYHSRRMMPYHVQHTGVARFQYTQFAENYPFSLPNLSIQRAIASTLGALDDKIELNRRMNETLEAMAQAIFKDWFVDFGPTRAKAEGRLSYLVPDLWSLFPDRLDSDGKPEGWQAGCLLDVCELKRGYDLPSAQRLPGPYPIVSSSGITGFHSAFMAKGPGIITGRYGTIGEVHFIKGQYWPLNTTLYVRDMKSNSALFIYYTLKRVDYQKYSDKGAVPGVNRNHLHQSEVIIPPRYVQDKFEQTLEPLWLKYDANIAESRTLAQTRDLLLPKLMSGEIRVRDAETLVENAL